MESMNLKVALKKTGAGHYKIYVFDLFSNVTKDVTDMQIVEDIREYKNDGHESELSHFESFAEVENYIKDIYNGK